MGATDSLRAAYSKAASLPAQEQDEIARLIVDRVEGGIPILPEFPLVTAIGKILTEITKLLDSILPKHPAARSVTLVFGYFALVQAIFVIFIMAPVLVFSLFLGK